ncbi:LacI family transcriptional regulator [Caldibacillus lycopersici]|uniref:LacI family transcriptional regulator n=1 Tax=Perspicuibacillus lycopersici TaxID=1325689 RepID=A0AAE3LMF6_9BACI|nr:LacI family DNA-binding transcriptional regulator [Perspicuibacillus lycopersici]MCU9612672.1 LacI family transcriptional regulator [Perspicuibacillus lycopersici]
MVSIKDIAKKADVSISTVSYALNGSTKITEETKARVLRIAKELNYVPNAAARTLKKRNTNIIGAFFTDYSGQFFGQLLTGLRKKLNEAGYDLVVSTGKESHRFLPEGIIDGAIILDANFLDDEIVNYAERGHKLVVLDRILEHSNIERVLLDNQTGAEIALHYLIEKGHQNIAIVSGPNNSYDSIERMKAVNKIIQQYPNLQFSTYQGDFDKQSGAKIAKLLVEQYTTPVAVFCLNDEMAIGMYQYLETTEFHVGEHFHIIGFDNIELSQFLRPRLASIHYSKEEWGSRAGEQILKLIHNEKSEPQTIEVSLIEGNSVQGPHKK